MIDDEIGNTMNGRIDRGSNGNNNRSGGVRDGSVKDSILPFKPVKRLIQVEDSNLRIADDAVYLLRDLLETNANNLIRKAIAITKISDRKTLKQVDIEKAMDLGSIFDE